jgi:hypothetical protein
VSGARAIALALGVGLVLLTAPPTSATAVTTHPEQARRQAGVTGSQPKSKLVSPNGPPLGAGGSPREGEDAGVPSAAGDQLVENGLASPLCKGSTSRLSSSAQNDCRTSGFVGASAPTNNYAFDVHIDVGTFGLSRGGLLSVIQDVFIAPVWSALVWIVHALVVMLEWCFTLELLDSSTMGGLARSLRQAQASFTEPWLALVLAVASILVFYNGLVRRRVTETLGQALTTLAMMAVGLWIIADPLGTVGAVGRWTNQASLGTLGAVAQGTPANAPKTLADGMRGIFSGAIEMPWCYLEFGNVHWCSDPALIDPRLRKAALRIAAVQQAKLHCPGGRGQRSCGSKGSMSSAAVEDSDELVREANTNGALFLAFPANEAQRNSVKDKGSLLAVLCQTEDDTKCAGPTAAQAEFRSDDGTFPRMIGVVLIAGGVLGMALLFGLVALRLLAAAIASMFLLLLAPFAVLAPALGESGRVVFGGWATRLLGSVVSKLLFSFLLGALLSMQRMLMSLEALGWWTQWFLISSLWWVVFFKRHQAIGFLQGKGHGQMAAARPSIARRIGRTFETPRAMVRSAGWAKRKILSPAPDVQRLRKRAQAARQTASKRAEEQTVRTLQHDHASAKARVRAHGTPQAQRSLASMRTQLERVRRARQAALSGGDPRRAAVLAVREQRVRGKLERVQRSFSEARRTIADGEAARRGSGKVHTSEQLERRARFLDEQMALAPSRTSRSSGRRRDYRALAGLAGYGREQYERLPPRRQREARLRIDRELALRSQLGTVAHEVARPNVPQLGRREQRRVDKEFDRALEQRAHASSPVMDDARAVAERRKRQLGYGPTR